MFRGGIAAGPLPLREFLYVAGELAGTGRGEGAMEVRQDGRDPAGELEAALRNVALGWPVIDKTAVGAGEDGRFVCSHPLQFPMGEGDLYDSTRPIPVSAPEWSQHLLRYARGMIVWDIHGQRLVWAIVNHVLLQEAVEAAGSTNHQRKRRPRGRRGKRTGSATAQTRQGTWCT